MMKKDNPIDLAIKKQPKQNRSKVTVDAIIQASAQILVKQGYHALNTNEVAKVAGVSIGSVYEYFPGKEAIVATLANELLDSSLKQMHDTIETNSEEDFEIAMRHWLDTLYNIVLTHKHILEVLIFQVPFWLKMPSTEKLKAELFKVAIAGAAKSQTLYQIQVKPETLYLISTMTGSTLLSLALDPSPRISSEAVLQELSKRIVDWLIGG